MLTDEDIIRITKAIGEAFPSKEDFEVFGRETKENFNGLRNDLNDFKKETRESFAKLVTLEEFDMSKREIEQDFSNLRESINILTNSIDKLVKQ
ncbi:hypothetical protein KKC65_01925 [Patescibacteria group bacterium]|nr:hypothetical protein [Patescibacteria group bacterium]